MKIKEILEVIIPFPTNRIKPVTNPPRYGADIIQAEPYQKIKQQNQQRRETQNHMDTFTTAYITAALWSSTDDNGEPLDNDYDVDDISDETFIQMVQDCKSFQQKYSELLSRSEMDDSQAGHDFWLTRNHHGAGFWDRGLPENIGNELTNAAQSYGEADLYIGDDGKIYS